MQNSSRRTNPLRTINLVIVALLVMAAVFWAGAVAGYSLQEAGVKEEIAAIRELQEEQVDRLHSEVERLAEELQAARDNQETLQSTLVDMVQLLDAAVEDLRVIINGPYDRKETLKLIDQIAEVIREVNSLLPQGKAEEISRVIVTQSLAADIDPWLLTAMAITETHCRPNIRGGSGEYGILQVMPGTGEWIAGRLGYTNWIPEDLWDLDTNIQFAAYYLRISIREFGGDVTKGILAYNRGSNGARAWLKENPAADHRYVRKVMAAYKRITPPGQALRDKPGGGPGQEGRYAL